MQGTVIRLLASVGATVAADTGVCVVEAMKMENLVRAGTAGTVTQVLVAAGDQIEPGAVIATVGQAD
jgi:biotin carboxyl carrier protein